MKFAIVETFSTWLKSTKLSSFVTGYPWVWPACETLHFIGLALLVGTIAVVDLRMLGIGKGLPFAPLHRLVRWGIAGFTMNLITGFMFYAGEPSQYIHNGTFQLKILFILFAGINALVFEFTVLPEVKGLGPGDDAPLKAKVIALTSLFLWVGVTYLGRMLPFLGEAF